MSTYGTAIVIDSPAGDALVEHATGMFVDSGYVYRSAAADGWTRVVVATEEIEQIEPISRLLHSLGTGRAAVAQDNDEFGAAWTVLAADGGTVRPVHRRYVLNADPSNPVEVARTIQDLGGTDPRADDVAGDLAASAAADLFRVDHEPMVEAERASEDAWQGLGTVGGAFPWWLGLGLPWPGPDAGEPVYPGEAGPTT